MDTFKIVATEEKRGVYFTEVPHKCEKNNILYWPPHHIKFSEREALRCDTLSIPNSTWTKIPTIQTFNEVLDLEKNCANTDAEEDIFPAYKKVFFEVC